jgi:hypothetical protein
MLFMHLLVPVHTLLDGLMELNLLKFNFKRFFT